MRHSSPYVFLSVAPLLLLAIIWMGRVADRKDAIFEKERINMRKGAVGEAVVALILDNFPNDYWIVHDLKTPLGNLDHVVVGPTGVYVIDTKNWRGIVSADGNGELLRNGEPTDKPAVRPVVDRTMWVRDKILKDSATDQIRLPEARYFQAVLVFPMARVEADWGTTGAAHCVRDEKLRDYIVESRKGRLLTTQQIESYAKAFRALAQMDGDFEVLPSAPPPADS